MTARSFVRVALPATAAVALVLAVMTLRPGPGGAANPSAKGTVATTEPSPLAVGRVRKSDAEWKRQLEPMAYHVLRERGTERAFTGKLLEEHRAGTYVCAGCGLPLFSSETKFDSGTGWPSFFSPVAKNHVTARVDTRYGGVSQEILCARCEGHLGHVFDDGPKPTGLRYCMNSAALAFEAAKPAAKSSAKSATATKTTTKR